MAEVLKKFGRYFLLDRLAQGGMAEIYRARLASADGAGRLIVIKRIQAGYGSNTEFLQMFKSEIKVTMGFSHPNIVQLYDFGEEQAQPYIVMEWVDGKNLRQFITRFAEIKQTFPIELAAFIIEQSASGLHYAHTFKDKITGKPLNIIHRDISPQNILIAYEGSVKVIDFGIAKAATNSENTRAGVIKGKPSYLSPEQISGEPLDARCDIFALGTVLWELLTGKKLFQGENDLAVLKLIESCQTHVKPPSTLNPKVPKELDYIVLKALAKQREKRFQTAEELQRALHKFLYTFAPDFNPSDLAYYAKDLFKEEIVDDRKRIQKLNDKVEQLLGTDLPELLGSSSSGRKGKGDGTVTVLEPKMKSSGAREVFNPNAIKDHRIEIESVPGAGTARGTFRGRTGANGGNTSVSYGSAPRQRSFGTQESSSGSAFKTAITAALAILSLSYLGPNVGVEIPVLTKMVCSVLGGCEKKVASAPEQGDTMIVLQGNQTGVTITANGKYVGDTLPVTLKSLPAETPIRIIVTGQNGSFTQDVSLKKGEKKQIPVELAGRTVTAKPTVLLRLNVLPANGYTGVILDGKRLDPRYPAANVTLDTPLELIVETTTSFKFLKREFFVDSKEVGENKEWRIDVPLESTSNQFGYLTIRTTPSASVKINGKAWGKRTPLENEKLPIGAYEIRLYSEALQAEKMLQVNIQEGKRVTIDEVKWDFENRRPTGR